MLYPQDSLKNPIWDQARGAALSLGHFIVLQAVKFLHQRDVQIWGVLTLPALHTVCHPNCFSSQPHYNIRYDLGWEENA